MQTFTVVHPFSSALYHIQDDVITYLNNFILLAQGNVSGALNDCSHLNGNEHRRTRVPQDYQDTSGCHSVFSCRVTPWPVAIDGYATEKNALQDSSLPDVRAIDLFGVFMPLPLPPPLPCSKANGRLFFLVFLNLSVTTTTSRPNASPR